MSLRRHIAIASAALLLAGALLGGVVSTAVANNKEFLLGGLQDLVWGLLQEEPGSRQVPVAAAALPGGLHPPPLIELRPESRTFAQCAALRNIAEAASPAAIAIATVMRP